MERIQLTENDRKTLTHAAAFGLRTTAGTEFAAESAEVEQALIDAREHLATTSDDCAYVIIRVETP